MYNHVLVPLDRSANAEKALAHAFHLAETSNARVSLLTVVEEAPVGLLLPESTRSAWRAEADGYLVDLVTRLPAHAFPLAMEITAGDPYEEIRRFVRERAVDVIVMGTHGTRSTAELPLGSTAWKLLQAAPVPVLLVQSRATQEALTAGAAAKLVRA